MARIGLGEWLAVTRALGSGNLLRYGDGAHRTEDFERRFAHDFGVRHVLTVNSGTSALIAAMAACGLGPGDEVLVPAYTWIATPAAAVAVGAVPVLVDIDESLTIDPHDIERKITPYTRAIVPVHMANAPCDMAAILAIAKKRNLIVIEDACQAVGVRYKDNYCGAMGDAGAYSFNAHKNINIGEGGAFVTNDDRLFARARNYHDVGVYVRGHADRYNEPDFVGMNMRVTELDGAMLGVQLTKLGPMMAALRKRRVAFARELEISSRFKISPHHDPSNAVTLTVIFDDAEDAIAFSQHPRVTRLYDNSKHVYTNWHSILNKRTFHPDMNPWKWARREIVYGDDMCQRTLDILGRTCRIALGGRLPPQLAGLVARRLARWAER